MITSQRETVGNAPFVIDTDADSQVRQYGVYATDTLRIVDTVAATFSVRYDTPASRYRIVPA